MKKAWLSFVLLHAAGVALAAGSASEPRLYGVTFSDYADGERLSNKGAVGGYWNDASAETTGAKTIGGRKCMTCDSASLLFNTTPGLNGAKVSKISLYMPGTPGLSDLPETDKAAFAIRVPGEGETGKAVFAGWSGTAWHELYGSVEPVTNTWYDLSVWFAKNLENQLQVQYQIKVGDTYEPLHTQDGKVWLDSGVEDKDAVVREVEIRGSGAFEVMSGRELPSPGLSTHFK